MLKLNNLHTYLLRFIGTVHIGIFFLLSTPTSAALIDNGAGLVYDTVLDITWAQPDALRSWDSANTWASSLSLAGVSGWRLPYASVSAGSSSTMGPIVNCSTATETACRDNEMGYMFYHNLSSTFGSSATTTSDPDLALFPTLQSGNYWTATRFDYVFVWLFEMDFGDIGPVGDSSNYLEYSWAVHDGNVTSAVPIPAAIWLLGSGLLGMIGISKRKE